MTRVPNIRPVARNVSTAALLLTAALAMAACQSTPEHAFQAWNRALRAGDQAEAMERMTASSQRLVRGFVAASPEHAEKLWPAKGLPDDVTVVSSAVQGDRAQIVVAKPDGRTLPVHLRHEDGGWRIDLVECQRSWSRAQRSRGLLELESL